MAGISKQGGATMVEAIIALALIAIAIIPLLQGLSTAITSSDRARDNRTMLGLAQSQIEDILKQSYQDTAGSYSLLSTVPPPYTIQVAASVPASYVYPNSTAAPQTVQLITITVTGDYSSMTLSGFKAR